jgi:adenylate kinase family enzyme
MNRTAIVLGIPGVGKSTVLYKLKGMYPKLQQFSVRLFTLQLMEGNSELGRYLRDNNIVQPGKYMPDHIVEQIFAEYMKHVLPDDLLIIEGFPVNEEQYYGMCRQFQKTNRSVDAVIVLEDDIESIQQRRKKRRICPVCEMKNGAGLPIPSEAKCCPFCGGSLTERAEDADEFFHQRCEKYKEELQFLSSVLPSEKIIRINVSKIDAAAYINTWRCC